MLISLNIAFYLWRSKFSRTQNLLIAEDSWDQKISGDWLAKVVESANWKVSLNDLKDKRISLCEMQNMFEDELNFLLLWKDFAAGEFYIISFLVTTREFHGIKERLKTKTLKRRRRQSSKGLGPRPNSEI